MSVSISIGTPPPAPIYEAVPAPRVGYVWAPGFWRWEHERHVWAPGHWIAGRRGHRWVADRWVEGPHGGWRHEPGHWDRQVANSRGLGDRDRDGVPDQLDNHPNDPLPPLGRLRA